MTIILAFHPFPVLETKNLFLRKLQSSDMSDLFEMRSDARMHLYTDTKPDENFSDTLAYIGKMNQGVEDNKWIIWAMEHKQTNKVIGTISIWNFNQERNSGELGYGVIPDYQGQGLMREALLRVIDFAFSDLRLHTLEAYTEENNQASLKLLEKCNFIKADRVVEKGYFSDKVYYMVVYKLVNQKYLKNG